MKQPQRIVFGNGCMERLCDDFLATGNKHLLIITAPPILPQIQPMICRLEERA